MTRLIHYLTIVFLFFSINAQAEFGACLPSDNTNVCVKEQANPSGGEYQITNNGGSENRIVAFAVTNSNTSNAITNKLGWDATVISQSEWDSGNYYLTFFDGNVIYDESLDEYYYDTGTNSAFGWLVNSSGSYADVLGTEELTANLYWQTAQYTTEGPEFLNVELIPFLENGISMTGFYWLDSLPNSNFVAFGTNGNILASSIAVVPEPNTYALLMVSLSILGLISRRKKS